MPGTTNKLLNKLNAAIDDYKQLLGGYPNATKFGNALVANINQHIPSNEDFRSPQAMSEWSQAAALNAPLGLTFIGPMATGWNSELAAKAKEMLDNGVKPEQVWHETMYGQMPDKSMFSEIADNEADFGGLGFLKLKKGEVDSLPLNSTGQDQVFSHDSFAKEYPSLMNNVDVALWKDKKPGGHFYGNDSYGQIRLNTGIKDRNSLKSTGLHELQHAVQSLEDWARGGSARQFAKEEIGQNNIIEQTINFINKELSNPNRTTPYDTLLEERSQLAKKLKPDTDIIKDAHDQYRRLTGEAQARATQDRLNMDLAARRNNYPLKYDYLSDIPLNKLINRYR